MYKRIPKQFINDLVDRVNIVDYVNQYATLKQVGQRGELRAKCPLPSHKDDTPSFYVNEHKQTYVCHGCGSGGGIVSFLKDMHGYEFVPAIEELADFMNLQIPYESSQKGDFISYSDIYKTIYNTAKAEKTERSQCDVSIELSDELYNSSGLVPVKPSLIKNVCEKSLKDKPEMYSNVISNLPDNDNELLMLPIRTQFSGSIECLFLFDDDDKCFLPTKPSRGYDKLVYSSHSSKTGLSKSAPSQVLVLTDPIAALKVQDSLDEDCVVMATVDEPINLSRKTLKPFVDSDGFFTPEKLSFCVYLDDPNVKPLLEHYLRLSSDYAARTEFHFYKDKSCQVDDYIDMNYQELFNTVIEDKFREFSQPEFARFVEYLLGGDKNKSHLLDQLRKQAYDTVGKPEEFDEHADYEYIKPSSLINFEKLAVPDKELSDIKTMVSSIINMSMDVTEDELKEHIGSLRTAVLPDSELLKKRCLEKLDFLSHKGNFIRMESFLDSLSDEEKEAYMNPIEDNSMTFI